MREPRNALEQAVLLGVTDVIEVHHLALSNLRTVAANTPAPVLGSLSPLPSAAPTTLIDLERSALIQALDHTGWNVSRAARVLGISRDTLRYRIDKHGLNEPPA